MPDETSKYDHKYNLLDRFVIDGFTQHPSLNGWTVEIEGFASDGRYHVAVVEPIECIGYHLRWVKEVNLKGLSWVGYLLTSPEHPPGSSVVSTVTEVIRVA